MASSQGCRVGMRCPHSLNSYGHGHGHSHHHQRHCPHCPLHRHCRHCPLHSHNPHFLPNFFQTLPSSISLPQNPHLSTLNQPVVSDAQVLQELEHLELEDEEDDDEPVFVLTDEWREFFAKSEARRKLEKKQGKKGKK